MQFFHQKIRNLFNIHLFSIFFLFIFYQFLSPPLTHKNISSRNDGVSVNILDPDSSFLSSPLLNLPSYMFPHLEFCPPSIACLASSTFLSSNTNTTANTTANTTTNTYTKTRSNSRVTPHISPSSDPVQPYLFRFLSRFRNSASQAIWIAEMPQILMVFPETTLDCPLKVPTGFSLPHSKRND